MIDKYDFIKEIIEVKNYHKEESAFFKVYKNCCISNVLRKNEIWEPHLHEIFNRYVNSDSVILEGGCHIGTHTIKLAKICRKLYAFEPLESSYNLLKINLDLNSLNNVEAFQKGLSDKPGNTNYKYITDGNPGGAVLSTDGSGKEFDCELTTIDSLNLEKLDFIKLDVEGYELLAIQGGINTIKKCKPTIIIESWKNDAGEIDIKYTETKFKILIDIGYQMKHISGPDFLFFIAVENVQTNKLST